MTRSLNVIGLQSIEKKQMKKRLTICTAFVAIHPPESHNYYHYFRDHDYNYIHQSERQYSGYLYYYIIIFIINTIYYFPIYNFAIYKINIIIIINIVFCLVC